MEKSLMYVKNKSGKDWIEKISNNEAQYVIAVHSHSDQPKIHAHIVTSCF